MTPVILFKKKQLTPTKRVCLRLKELREEKGVSLSELSKRTKICSRYLKALEECRFNDLPTAEVYQKNFVKNYVVALGLNPGPFLSQYNLEEKVKTKIKHPLKILKQNWLNNLPFILRHAMVVLLVLGLVFYLGLQVKRIIEPPKLSLFSPQEGYITESGSLMVQGQTEKEARVYLNGKEIRNNEQGQFKELVDLSLGVNTITINVEKKHGKNTTVTRHVVLKESKSLSFNK